MSTNMNLTSNTSDVVKTVKGKNIPYKFANIEGNTWVLADKIINLDELVVPAYPSTMGPDDQVHNLIEYLDACEIKQQQKVDEARIILQNTELKLAQLKSARHMLWDLHDRKCPQVQLFNRLDGKIHTLPDYRAANLLEDEPEVWFSFNGIERTEERTIEVFNGLQEAA